MDCVTLVDCSSELLGLGWVDDDDNDGVVEGDGITVTVFWTVSVSMTTGGGDGACVEDCAEVLAPWVDVGDFGSRK